MAGSLSRRIAARTVRMKTRVTSTRQAMYKKSPVRSPLREVIKSRCQERMRADRDRIVSGVRYKIKFNSFNID